MTAFSGTAANNLRRPGLG